jgi:hypothetical protein
VFVATIVLVVLSEVLFVAALWDLWPSIAAALIVAVTTALTYTAVREGPRSIIALWRR